MLPKFTPEIEQRLSELQHSSLNSDEFWAAVGEGVPNSPYLEYIWRQQWLSGKLSAAQVWQAAQAMADPVTGQHLWQFPHTPLAEALSLARQLRAQGVPGIVEYGEYLLTQHGVLGQLRWLMEQVNFAESEDVSYMLTRIASLLLHGIMLKVGTKRYLLREIEFYFCQPRTHDDPYVHKSREQQQHGHWYFNEADGLDLTFGSQESNTWGGILLRGLQHVPPYSEVYVDPNQAIIGYVRGPRLVLRDIIANLNGVFEQSRGIELDEIDIPTQAPVWRARRYGLRHKPEADADGDYLHRHYRFLTDPNYLRGLKDRADVIRQLQLPRNEAKEILGYYPSA